MNYVILLPFCFSYYVQCCQGGSGGCCRKQPPVVVNCGSQSSCQQGYGCGQYGCAKRKAFGGITKRIDGVLVNDDEYSQAYLPDASLSLEVENYSHNISIDRLTNPNFIFRSCCEARGLPDTCLAHCNFNTYTPRTLEKMFNKIDSCPIEALNEIHYCAAQGIDHRVCCNMNGVGSTAAGKKCLTFCDQRPNKFTPIDATYLPCFEVFEGMKQCFFHEIKRRAGKKFGFSMTSTKTINSV